MNQTITHKYLRHILDNLSEENFNDLLMELQYSTLIIAANEHDGIPIVEFNKEPYIPLFTDIHEFEKFKNPEDLMAIDNDFNVYLEMLDCEEFPGFVINPDSEKFPIKKEFLRHMKPDYIFEQDYESFTTSEIRRLKNSIDNTELNEFISEESNRYDLYCLMRRLEKSTLLTLLMSHKDYSGEAEDGVIYSDEKIPKCLYGVWDKSYILLFSREPTKDTIPDDSVFKYTQIVNLPLLIRDVLNYDIDGFILNVDNENIIISREHLRKYMKDFSCPVLDDYGMYAFTIPEGE